MRWSYTSRIEGLESPLLDWSRPIPEVCSIDSLLPTVLIYAYMCTGEFVLYKGIGLVIHWSIALIYTAYARLCLKRDFQGTYPNK